MKITISSFTIYLLFILMLSGYIKYALIIFIIVFIHEMGHVLIARILKYEITSITIYPFGGITKINKDLNTLVYKELLIASGGIIAQAILAILVYILPISMSDKLIFYKYNTSILVFNILPIIPLDGSMILRSVLNKFRPFKESYQIYIIISIISTFLYFLYNTWYSLNNYLIITLFIYKTFEAIKYFKYTNNRFLLERYLKDIEYNSINTSTGNLDILRIGTFQYFKNGNKVESERIKLQEKFDNKGFF